MLIIIIIKTLEVYLLVNSLGIPLCRGHLILKLLSNLSDSKYQIIQMLIIINPTWYKHKVKCNLSDSYKMGSIITTIIKGILINKKDIYNRDDQVSQFTEYREARLLIIIMGIRWVQVITIVR